MASVVVEGGTLRVRLSPWERLAALHGDLVVPRSAVRGVEVLDAPFAAVPRLRSLGTAVPGLLAYGTFRGRGRKELVAVRRGTRAVRLTLDGQRFTAVVVGVGDPAAVAAALAGG